MPDIPSDFQHRDAADLPTQAIGHVSGVDIIANQPTKRLGDLTDMATERMAAADGLGDRVEHGKIASTTRLWQRMWATRRAKIISALLLVAIIGGVVSSTFLVAGTVSYQHEVDLAQQGVTHISKAQDDLKQVAHSLFDAKALSQARAEFAAANGDFTQLSQDLSRVPSSADGLPKYGPLLVSARKVVPIAVGLSQAGEVGCDAFALVTARLHNPLDSKAQGITPADLTALTADLAQLQSLLATSVARINQLQPADLHVDSRIGPAIALFQADLPKIVDGLNTVQTVVSIAPQVLGVGQPSNFLVEVLDSSELRPGGGFIGNYGTATISGARLEKLDITDVDLLDRPYGKNAAEIPYPVADSWYPNLIQIPSWSLRDSNLDADFPTNAKYGEQNYVLEGGKVKVAGVIALNADLIRDMIKITGPIYVPEYKETVTAENLIPRIHYHQLLAQEGRDDIPSPDGKSSLRKHFLAVLFGHFFAKVKSIAGSSISKFMGLGISALHTKDLQVYLNPAAGETLLHNYGIDAAMQAPATGDSLMTVDANFTGSKANDYMTYLMRDQITLDADGTATHQMTLTYNWPVSAEANAGIYYIKTFYHDLIRAYVPPGSTLTNQIGWSAYPLAPAFGRDVFSGVFNLFYGQSGTVALTWTVPHAAMHDASGWHYHLLLQRQPSTAWDMRIALTLPTCATITGHPAIFTATSKNQAQIAQFLTTDLATGVDYAC